jgi:hypothetical protein
VLGTYDNFNIVVTETKGNLAADLDLIFETMGFRYLVASWLESLSPRQARIWSNGGATHTIPAPSPGDQLFDGVTRANRLAARDPV